ncbi:hypothetical protein Thermo_00372 [Thermoplasmatales archaeon]|nr:hypothetical protein Thermo_00372 [Thermoplasmatales archaeon]
MLKIGLTAKPRRRKIKYSMIDCYLIMNKMNPKRKKIIIEILPGGIASLPISLYLASAEIKYHPYWHSFVVSYLGFWFLIFAGIWSYYYIISLKIAIRNYKEEK